MQKAQCVEMLLRHGANVDLSAQLFTPQEVETFCRVAKSNGSHVTIPDRFTESELETFALAGGKNVTIRIIRNNP